MASATNCRTIRRSTRRACCARPLALASFRSHQQQADDVHTRRWRAAACATEERQQRRAQVADDRLGERPHAGALPLVRIGVLALERSGDAGELRLGALRGDALSQPSDAEHRVAAPAKVAAADRLKRQPELSPALRREMKRRREDADDRGRLGRKRERAADDVGRTAKPRPPGRVAEDHVRSAPGVFSASRSRGPRPVRRQGRGRTRR